MPVKEVLIQTRVTLEQHQLIEAAAGQQGMTIAAYVRNTAMQYTQSPVMHAWVTSTPGEAARYQIGFL